MGHYKKIRAIHGFATGLQQLMLTFAVELRIKDNKQWNYWIR